METVADSLGPKGLNYDLADIRSFSIGRISAVDETGFSAYVCVCVFVRVFVCIGKIHK
jgi:hypothetical protein